MSARSDLVASLAHEAGGAKKEAEKLWAALEAMHTAERISFEGWREQTGERAAVLSRLAVANAEVLRLQQQCIATDVKLEALKAQHGALQRQAGDLQLENAELLARLRKMERREVPPGVAGLERREAMEQALLAS